MRRSVRFECAHIAEGSGRNPEKNFAQFVEIAYGSAMEVAPDGDLALNEGYRSEAGPNHCWLSLRSWLSRRPDSANN